MQALRQLDAARQRQAPAIADAIERIIDDEADLSTGAIVDPPATQQELAYWCLQHPAPGMQIRSVPEPDGQTLSADGATGCLAIIWPYAPPHLGIGGTEEVLATFSGELADRHPPTGPTSDVSGIEQPGREGVRLLTWGDPYLTAWLTIIRGEALVESDYQAIGIIPEPIRCQGLHEWTPAESAEKVMIFNHWSA